MPNLWHGLSTSLTVHQYLFRIYCLRALSMPPFDLGVIQSSFTNALIASPANSLFLMARQGTGLPYPIFGILLFCHVVRLILGGSLGELRPQLS